MHVKSGRAGIWKKKPRGAMEWRMECRNSGTTPAMPAWLGSA